MYLIAFGIYRDCRSALHLLLVKANKEEDVEETRDSHEKRPSL